MTIRKRRTRGIGIRRRGIGRRRRRRKEHINS